jgi:NAD-dependent deacetylase
MFKKKLVVLTGAGISAESGLKTFRDTDGLWEGYDLNEVATPRAWKKNPALVLEFYNMRRKNVKDARPNRAHETLAALQEQFNVQVITQNIDDLHERAGSENVMHLHGEIMKMRSEQHSHMIYPIADDILLGQFAEDGAQLRPHIVWFEEMVPMIPEAIPLIQAADFFAVIGTSLAVYPAAGLINYAPWPVPKFIIDKKIPATGALYNLTAIEKPASEGVEDMRRLLLEMLVK